MQRLKLKDFDQFDLEIKPTFSFLRREQLEAQQKHKEVHVVEENLNQITIMANLGATQSNVTTTNENAIIIGEYMVPLVVET